MRTQWTCLLACLGFARLAKAATPRFSNVFASHMVLQRNKALNLWGFGQVLNGTRVCLGKDCVLATPSPSDSLWASSLGSRWTASLPARPASSDPQTLVLVDPRGRIVQQLDDLVVGDVFLFSGQSNIDIPETYGHQIYDPTTPGCQPQNDSNRLCSRTNATAQSSTESFADKLGLNEGLIRLMIVPGPPQSWNATPVDELLEVEDCALCPRPATPYVACGCDAMRWTRANASNVRGFSATAWFTGAALLRQTAATRRVPIGLIRASMGGTPIQLWSSPTALRACGAVSPGRPFWRPYSSLFWSMIFPLRGLRFAAMTWFQGEANVGPDRSTPPNWGTGPTGPRDYACQLPAMLSDWRRVLSAPTLPVLVVELSAYCNEYDTHTFLTHCDQRTSHLSVSNSHLPALRHAQAAALNLSHVYMVPNHDLGSLHPVSGSIHSAKKPQLGTRIALSTLAALTERTAASTAAVWDGPVAVSAHLDPKCAEISRMVPPYIKQCVVVAFAMVPGAGALHLDEGARCPEDVLPFYCNGTELVSGSGFELYGHDAEGGRWHAASYAQLSASAINSVVLGIGDMMVTAPTRVRYAWADWPVTSVRNGPEGHSLPARIFDIVVT